MHMSMVFSLGGELMENMLKKIRIVPPKGTHDGLALRRRAHDNTGDHTPRGHAPSEDFSDTEYKEEKVTPTINVQNKEAGSTNPPPPASVGVKK